MSASTRARAIVRRCLAASAVLAVVAFVAVPVLVNGGEDHSEVGVRADGGAPAQAPPEERVRPAAVTEGGAPVPPGSVSTLAPAARAAKRRPVPGTAPSATATSAAPLVVTTATVPVTQTTVLPSVPVSIPAVCPAPPAPAWTLTAPGFYVVPIDGARPRPILAGQGFHPNEVVASPDGKQLIFSDFDPSENNGQNPFEVYTVNVDGSGLQAIDTGAAHPNGFAWSPDGRWIAFHEQVRAEADIWVMAPDGSQRRKLFTYPVPGYGWLRWSPDSTHLAASSANDGAGAWAINVATGDSIRLVQEAVWQLDWSPDSKRLVVDITDGSPPSMNGPQMRAALPIVVINADGTSRRELVPQGVWAVWSPAGDGIALRDGGLINPDTLARGSYGPGSALAYASDGEHLLATGSGLLINDRRGCSFPLVVTDNRGSPTFAGWAGTQHTLVRVLPIP